MKIIIQRCKDAQVTVNQKVVGKIGTGLMLLVGIGQGDTAADAVYLADKTAGLRIFEDAEGKMNDSVLDVGGPFCLSRNLRCMVTAVKGEGPTLWERPNLRKRRSCMISLTASFEPRAWRSRRGFSEL